MGKQAFCRVCYRGRHCLGAAVPSHLTKCSVGAHGLFAQCAG